MDYIKERKKKGMTYIEVLSSLFIILTIITISFPLIAKSKKPSIDTVSNQFVSELKYIKSLAISKDSNMFINFLGDRRGYLTYLEAYSDGEKQGEYRLPKNFVFITRKADLLAGDLVFKPDGTLGHRATTIKVKDIENNKESSITLTIGYTRIKRID